MAGSLEVLLGHLGNVGVPTAELPKAIEGLRGTAGGDEGASLLFLRLSERLVLVESSPLVGVELGALLGVRFASSPIGTLLTKLE